MPRVLARSLAALVPTLFFCAAAVGCARPDAVARAQQMMRMHREAEAVAMLQAHLGAHPDDLPARRLLVRVYASTGDLAAAKREVVILQRRMPNDPTPLIELGHAFELTHRYDEALAAYDQAADDAPTSPAGPREGGMRSARWGEIEEARPRLEEAIRRGANEPEIHHALGLVRVHLRDLDGAAEAYTRGLAADPNSLENRLGLATVAVLRGDARAALTEYDRILLRKPAFVGAILGRAWALAKLDRRDLAEEALGEASRLGAAPEKVARVRAEMK